MNNFKYALIGFSILGLTACSTSQLSRDEVLSKNTSLNELSRELKKARADNVQLLAPEGFQKVNKQFETALEEAKEDEKGASGGQKAKAALSQLKKVREDAETSRKVFEEILTLRERAREAKAASLYSKEFESTEKAFKKAARYVERGKLNDAREVRPQLIKSYANLEIRALKKGTLSEAKQAFQKARKNDADDHAPKSYQLAEKEIELAASVLEADRGQLDKAGFHAKKAKYLSERATEIAILAKSFERRDFTREDTILWHQEQLNDAVKKINSDLPFNMANRDVIQEIQKDIDGLLASQKNLRDLLQQNQEQLKATIAERDKAIAELQAEKGIILSNAEKVEKARKQREEKFERLQNMFSEEEANVYLEGKKVIIKSHGFDFPVGKADIKTQNFILLDKIVDSIKEFPGASVFVSGHTDATGDDELNMKLSKERAKNVAEFLTKVGKIPEAQVAADGLGEAKPVASNNTKKGRALNRRIEVVIDNI